MLVLNLQDVDKEDSEAPLVEVLVPVRLAHHAQGLELLAEGEEAHLNERIILVEKAEATIAKRSSALRADRYSAIISSLPDRLMVGHRPLEAGILVRIQVRQHEKDPQV